MAVIIVGAIAVLILAYFIGKEFSFIASEKGYSAKKYFWWSFLLGFVGWSMVISLPNRGCCGVDEQIREFKALLDEGILTEEEFNAKKLQLLER